MLTDQQALALQYWMRGSLGHAENPSTRYIEDAVNALVAMAKTVVHVSEFGASTAASTNGAVNKSAILAAINAATVLGVTVTGGGQTYGISGNLEVPANTSLQDITLKQLTPDAAGDVRTLTSDNSNNIRLVRVRVDRNGDGTNGSLNDDAGIYISGGSGHYFEGIEVFGDDMGTGFVIVNATKFTVVNPLIRDMDYSLGSDPGDDRVQGMWIASCSDFTVYNPRARDLGGNYGSGATPRYTRGLVFSGCSDFYVHGPRVDSVDQGMDFTGSVPGNVRFEVTGGVCSDCYTWGYKFANSARDGTIIGAVAVRCGSSGFVASGPGATDTVVTGDLDFIGCSAYDTGSNGAWGTTAGFRIIEGQTTAAGTPRGIRFIGCKAHDRQGVPTMDYGFLNTVAANTDGRYNEAIDCVSIGHITAAFQDFNQGRVDLSLAGGADSLGDNAWEVVNWNTETDLGAMYTPNDGQIFARRAGSYQITATVFFEANATGQRGVRIVGNGGATIGAQVLVDAAAAGVTVLQASWTRKMTAGDEVRIEAFQNSGGPLNADGSSTAVVEQVT
jgi:hypothetical protein